MDSPLLTRAHRDGFIRVGYADEVPYGYRDDSGRVTGEAPEVARAVLRELGIGELRGVETEFGSLIAALQADRFDLIAAGMFITGERAEQILFSDPDYCALQAFVVRRGNPLDLHDYRDVAGYPEAILGVLRGAVEGRYAEDAGIPDTRIRQLASSDALLEAVRGGQADAAALTSISLQRLIEDDPDLEAADPFIPVIDGEEEVSCGGYGFRRENRAFRDAFNDVLLDLRTSDRILEIVRPFGFARAEIETARRYTARELARG